MHVGVLSPEHPECPGTSRFRGQVTMVAAHPSGLYNTRESALLAGVQPPTIRDWRRKKYLVAQGLDERGYPLHTAAAIRAAEQLARAKGIEASGVDPRQLRLRPAA
jgi:hypothetical protein